MLSFLLTLSLQAPIEFKPGVARVPIIVAKLAEKTGLKLRSGINLQNDVVGICAPRATKEEIMARLAASVDGEWVTQGDEQTLVRTEETEKRQLREHEQHVAKRVQESLDKLPGDYLTDDAQQKAVSELKRLNGLSDPNHFDPNVYAQRQKAAEAAPLQRFLYKVIKRIGTAKLLEKNPWGRLVFTISPNRLQKKLPATLAEVEAMTKAHDTFADLVGDKDLPDFYNNPAKKIGSPVANMIVSVKQRPLVENGGLSVSLKLISKKGEMLAQVQYSVTNGPFAQGPPVVLPTGKDTIIELDNLSKQFVATIKNLQSGPNQTAVSPELSAFMRRPDQNEITGLVTTECLNSIALSTQKNVVLSMGDLSFFMLGFQSIDGKATVRRFDSAMSQTGRVREEAGGWITYRATDPCQDRIIRLNRTMMTEYFKRIESGATRLDSFAKMALQHPGLLEDTSYPVFFLLLGQQPPGNFGRSLNAVRFFGVMSSEQKKAALAGSLDLKVHDLSKDQYRYAELLAFGEGDEINSYTAQAPAEVSANDTHGPPLTEPTFTYPEGLVDPFSIRISAIDKPSMFSVQSYGSYPSDENSIAFDLLQIERQDLFPYAGSMDTQNRTYVQGHQRTWQMDFFVTPNGSLNQQLNDHTVPAGAGKKYRDLPDEFKKVVQERLVELRRQYKDMKPTDFGNGPRKSPPPQP
ncbi:MAG: hypothetical protein ABL949_00410 [Fimbriimonadaceae bacterium]